MQAVKRSQVSVPQQPCRLQVAIHSSSAVPEQVQLARQLEQPPQFALPESLESSEHLSLLTGVWHVVSQAAGVPPLQTQCETHPSQSKQPVAAVQVGFVVVQESAHAANCPPWHVHTSKQLLQPAQPSAPEQVSGGDSSPHSSRHALKLSPEHRHC